MDSSSGYSLSELAEELSFEVVLPSSDYDSVMLTVGDVHRPGLQLTGFFDYFNPHLVQLIGKMEESYMSSFDHDEKLRRYNDLFSRKIPALVVCHSSEMFPEILEAAGQNNISVLTSAHNTSDVMADVIRLVKRAIAPSITRHGVLVEVYGIGLLLLGESGVGKSEAAIELLKRGHRLIADDAVEIRAVDVNVVQGTSPELIRYYMELRGIGIIDVRQIFGVGAIKNNQNIHLVVNLEQWKEGPMYDRLGLEEQKINILGVDVAEITIPVRPGRNLAVILEVAAMNQRQKFMGYNAALEFTKQINKQLDDRVS